MADWMTWLKSPEGNEVRYVHAVHVDGRRVDGEFLGLAETANGEQVVVRAFDGTEHRYFASALRALTRLDLPLAGGRG
ncbi:MAG: hypothetical protein KA419_10025 [Acidobacteria bacterium]|nr:hypothetical protein [Acidobacteriota bacterium]